MAATLRVLWGRSDDGGRNECEREEVEWLRTTVGDAGDEDAAVDMTAEQRVGRGEQTRSRAFDPVRGLWRLGIDGPGSPGAMWMWSNGRSGAIWAGVDGVWRRASGSEAAAGLETDGHGQGPEQAAPRARGALTEGNWRN